LILLAMIAPSLVRVETTGARLSPIERDPDAGGDCSDPAYDGQRDSVPLGGERFLETPSHVVRGTAFTGLTG
jgi:hypothetical protein